MYAFLFCFLFARNIYNSDIAQEGKISIPQILCIKGLISEQDQRIYNLYEEYQDNVHELPQYSNQKTNEILSKINTLQLLLKQNSININHKPQDNNNYELFFLLKVKQIQYEERRKKLLTYEAMQYKTTIKIKEIDQMLCWMAEKLLNSKRLFGSGKEFLVSLYKEQIKKLQQDKSNLVQTLKHYKREALR